MTAEPLILASGSTARAKILTDAGVAFTVERPTVDEEAVKLGLRAEGLAVRDQADALAEGVTPFADVADGAAAPNLTPSGIAPQSAPRPKPRPTTRTVSVGVSSDTAPVAVAAEIDPATLTVGTRLVQLGAFDDSDGARSEWARLQGRFGELLAAKSMVVQAAQSGGRTFYRLRAHGFADEDEARRFCAALVAENTPCIPAQHR
jgi:hypothetical protein